MLAPGPVMPPVLANPLDDPEHYELLSGGWARKEHSKMGRMVLQLLRPYADQWGCEMDTGWTVVGAGRKIIPDVTLSYPSPEYVIEDGYLVAPALLAVESRSRKPTNATKK